MAHLKPLDQKTSAWQRTTLLATDNCHSIIAVIVDDKLNHIAYTAYGEHSAQQANITRLGFNGQLREAKTGWYLLGNGYRAYNTRLMRFHSPDSWSPFGSGGLNAYMYCVGDPVNRSDPTGHFNWLRFFGFNQRKSWNAYGVSNVPDTALNIEIGMRPEATDGFASLLSTVTVAGGRATGPGGISSTPVGNSPALIGASASVRNYPAVETAVFAGTARPTSRPTPRVTSSSDRSFSGMGPSNAPPPTYNQAMALSNHNTFAASQGGQTFVVNRVPDIHNNYANLRAPRMEHPIPAPPPVRPRTPTPSPPTSRDSTPPRSRHNSGGNNTPNLNEQRTWLRFLR